MKDKYLKAFMSMVEIFSETSESKRLKVAACLIKNGNPICFGTNGTPPGWPSNICEDENGNTLPEVLHAEVQCLNKLRKISETSIGATLLITHSPCIRCCREIVDAGIKQVFYKYEYRDLTGVQYLKDNGVDVIKIGETNEEINSSVCSCNSSRTFSSLLDDKNSQAYLEQAARDAINRTDEKR